MPSVFWSWQSDASQRETRAIIKEALETAVSNLNGEVEEAVRSDATLSVDHDTKGLPGSPDIVASILEKIDHAVAFVADVTPIGLVDTGKKKRHVANPNVLIELGYAKKSLGLARVVQIWNTAITNCTIEDLPFDMRGRRGPISFSLPVGASTGEYRITRDKLAKELEAALSAIEPVSKENSWPDWKAANQSNPAIWFEEGSALTVNEPGHGSGKKVFPKGPTQYARLLPKVWHNSADLDHSHMLGHSSGCSWGRTQGGLLTYSGSVLRPELASSTNGTIIFKDTGEIWSIDRWVVSDWREKQLFHGDDMFDGVVSFLSRQMGQMIGAGARLPFKIKLGVSGLLESYWPLANPFYGEPAALEDQVEVEGVVTANSREEVERIVVEYWTSVRDAYGIGPPDKGRVAKAMEYFRG